jgi:cytochrome c peroxidase
MKKKLLLLFLAFFALVAFRSQPIFHLDIPTNWPKPHYDFSSNPLSKEKIELGRTLFYDPILSRNNTISCANCHLQYTAFTHVDHALSHGIDDKIGTRNAPALINLAWNTAFMWDGAINHLDMQALAPISNPNEMDNSIENVVAKFRQSKIYPALFLRAFGDSNITGERMLKTISQFMVTLVSSNSKYDSVQRHQTEYTAQENNGYRIFRENCASCHQEPLFTNFQYENNGLAVDSTLNDIGRINITKNPDDSLKFKVPTLRNIEFSYPYMHDGRFRRLSDVLKHYTVGIHSSKTLSKQLKQPIELTSNEKVDVIAFLLTLTDKKFLFDTAYSFPKYIFFPSAKD